MGETTTTKLSADDYVEIQQLYARYATALDTGDGDTRITTFIPDGTFRSSISDHRPETVDILRARTNAQGNKGSRHLQYNLLLTPTDEGVDGSVFLLFLHGSNDQMVRGESGFYKDKLVKTAEGWRFKSREVWMDAEGVNP